STPSSNSTRMMISKGVYPHSSRRRNYHQKEQLMELGAFSISLSVKDIEASRNFYEKFGFRVMGGDQSQNWLILNNGETVIGLFQGIFEGNLLTFNPGWNQQAEKVESFTDVRQLQRQLKDQG